MLLAFNIKRKIIIKTLNQLIKIYIVIVII